MAVKSTCFVALGRFGDIIGILPALRALPEKPILAVAKEFASVLDGVSYVDPLVLPLAHTELIRAMMALRGRFEKVVVTQMSATGWNPPRVAPSFNQDAWARMGMLDRWNDPSVQLVFDRRDPERERQLIAQHIPPALARPVLLVNTTSSFSSRFAEGRECMAWLRSIFGEAFHIVDLAPIRCTRIYDLVGLMEVADALLTIDTATLHLAAATRVPTVALLSSNGGWYQSTPRCNAVMAFGAKEWKAKLGALRTLLFSIAEAKRPCA